MSKRKANEDLQHQKQKRSKLDYQETIKVLVGPAEDPFTIHVHNICAKSAFFDAACSTEWKEGQEKLVRLPTIKPRIFKVYAHWTYTGKINMELVEHPGVRHCEENHIGCQEGCEAAGKFDTYCWLYIAADMLLDSEAKIAILDGIRKLDLEGSGINFGRETIGNVWSKVAQGCGLERWLLDAVAARSPPAAFRASLEAEEDRLPYDFIADLAVRQMEVRVHEERSQKYDPMRVHACTYHDRAEGEECDGD